MEYKFLNGSITVVKFVVVHKVPLVFKIKLCDKLIRKLPFIILVEELHSQPLENQHLNYVI